MAKVTVKKEQNFTVISNDIFKDTRLSFKAKGLLTTMLSCPPNWNYTIEGLSKISKDGKASIRTALAELEECGYLERKQLRNEKGAFVDLEYIVYENPKTDLPMSENRITENPISGNCTQLNTDILNTNELNTDLLKTDGLNTETEKGDTLSFDNDKADTMTFKKSLPYVAPKKSKSELKELEQDMINRFRKVAQQYDVTEVALNNIINAFKRYLCRYTEKTNKVHPILKDETLDKIFIALATIDDEEYEHYYGVADYEVDEYGISYLDELVDEHFKSEHQYDTDYHISHFANSNYLSLIAQHIVEY